MNPESSKAAYWQESGNPIHTNTIYNNILRYCKQRDILAIFCPKTLYFRCILFQISYLVHVFNG